MTSGPLGVPSDLTAGVCRRAWLAGESRPPWRETSLLWLKKDPVFPTALRHAKTPSLAAICYHS